MTPPKRLRFGNHEKSDSNQYKSQNNIHHQHLPPNSDCDLMMFKGNISCYILLINFLLTLENTRFIAGEFSLNASLVLYLPIGRYEF